MVVGNKGREGCKITVGRWVRAEDNGWIDLVAMANITFIDVTGPCHGHRSYFDLYVLN